MNRGRKSLFGRSIRRSSQNGEEISAGEASSSLSGKRYERLRSLPGEGEKENDPVYGGAVEADDAASHINRSLKLLRRSEEVNGRS
jgi:hypothetical protein